MVRNRTFAVILALTTVVTAGFAKDTRVLALASDVDSCQQLAEAMKPFGIQVTVIKASPDLLTAMAADGAELRQNYDALFFQEGLVLTRDVGAEFLAVVADAGSLGMGIVLEGGPSGFAGSGIDDTVLGSRIPCISMGNGPSSRRENRSDKPVLPDTSSGLVYGLDWSRLPKISDYSLLYVRQESKAKVLAADLPILIEWTVGRGRVIQFASGLTGEWSKSWASWPSFDAFRARLFLAAAGWDDKRLKTVIAKKVVK